jgi:hypothetical protein
MAAAELLRVYHSAECGSDGYPLAWRQGSPRIPDYVREAADHRCARCRHPYRTKRSDPEWSPCDERCLHGGPVRIGSEESGWNVEEKLPPTIAEFIDLADLNGLHVQARWRVLTVHHLTGEKADCRWWNLAALCQRCHLTIQGRVKMHQVYPWEHSDWFKPYAAGFYAVTYLGEDLSREQVEARQDELLALERAT